jgi:hypothetical protein
MPARRLALSMLALAASTAADAQTIVTSPGPERVAVTVYRDPRRDPSEAFNLNWLNGYALISETRQIALPAGESEVRFEGVAGGIVPQSAIVTGFPDGIVERNRDASLLSPGTLVDRSLGRRVTIRRTMPGSGAVRETEAVIRSTAAGVVLQTPDGIEALRCSGLPEGLVFASVPAGLSARPTLSVRARSRAPVAATVTLSYLASGFDWQANYIATLSGDGGRLDLFAWLTLASNDETGFVAADTQAVAGRLNRESARVQPREGGPINLQCWPRGTTSDIPLRGVERRRMGTTDDAQAIMVTGSRIPRANYAANSPVTVINAELEALGDLKLYRIPEPVTVAANGQKQVALLHQPTVAVQLVYRQTIDPGGAGEPASARRVLITRNRAAEGLGVPLPGGPVALFGAAGGRTMLLGQGQLADRAVGEDVEIEVGEAPGVISRVDTEAGPGDHVLTVTNDQAVPVRFEAEFQVDDDHDLRPRGHLSRRNGQPLWTVTVPANGSASLRYRLVGQ